MQKGALGLLLFGILIFWVPEVIAYMFGAFILFLGGSMLYLSHIIKKQKQNQKDYVKFGEYKIYRNNK